MIYNQSQSLQSKSSILLFATTCPNFSEQVGASGKCVGRVSTLPGGWRYGRRVPGDKKIRKGLEATMTRTTALIDERSYHSGRSPMQAVRMSRFGCDWCQKRVPVSSSRQISGHLGVRAPCD
jgi:hypothetical protein